MNDQVANMNEQVAVQAPADQANRNVQAVMRYYEGPWEQGTVELLDELYADDFVGHATAMPEFDLDGLRELIRTFGQAFSNLKITSEDVIATEDAVAVRWRNEARFTGEWGGFSPTGEVVRTTGLTFYRFREGRIAEHWTEWDVLGLTGQLEPTSSEQ